jgi:hypothetical protein
LSGKAIRKPFDRTRVKECECSVKVFNSSVENRVEKNAARLGIARPAKAYFTLHYFWAIYSQGEIIPAAGFFLAAYVPAKMKFTFTDLFKSGKTFLRGSNPSTSEAEARA